MNFGPEINSPEARQIAQQIYDLWVKEGADPRLAMYMVGLSFHESNRFDLNAHDQPDAYGLYQTGHDMWHHMQRVSGSSVPDVVSQVQTYINSLKSFHNGQLWYNINSVAGDPNKIFDTLHATGSKAGFAFDPRTRGPAAQFADQFSRIITPAGPSPDMVRGYTGFNAAASTASPFDQIAQSLMAPAGLTPQQQTQQAINYQYASPESINQLVGNYLHAPGPEPYTPGPGQPAEPFNVPAGTEAVNAEPIDTYRSGGANDYFPQGPLPGIGAPFVETGPVEGGGAPEPQLLSDIATYDESGAHAFSPYDPNFEYGNPGNIPNLEGMAPPVDTPYLPEPNYQMTGDFQPRASYTPGAEGAHSGFDPYNWPTAEGMEPAPVDIYQPADSAYQPADEAISGVPDTATTSGAAADELWRSGADQYGNVFDTTLGTPQETAQPATAEDLGGAEPRITGISEPSGDEITQGPFAGFNTGSMDEWHTGAGLNLSGAPSYEGTTAGPEGDQLAYQTTSYYDPQLGYVPQAQLANAQASTFSDFLNPFSGNSAAGLSTTQKVAGVAGSGIGSAAGTFFLPIPGVGSWVGGKLGGMFGRWVGGLGGPNERQAGTGGPPPMPTGSVSLPTHDPYAPSAYSPTGTMGRVSPETGQTREWWSGDFGRGLESAATGQGPGDWSYNTTGSPPGSYGLGFTGHTVGNFATAIGFGGNLGGGGPVNLAGMLARHTPWYISTPENPINYGGHSTDAPSGYMLTPAEHAWLAAGGIRAGMPPSGSTFGYVQPNVASTAVAPRSTQ